MRKKIFFGIMGVTALLFQSACSSEEPINGQNGNSDNAEAYMTLQLVGPEGSATTRTTPGADGTEAGTAVQNKISSATIFLCDPTSHQVQHVYNVSDLKPTANGAQTEPIKTTTGTFDVYVIANPGSVSLAEGTDVTGMTIENVTENLMKTAYANDNQFIMFNESNGSDDISGSSITIKAENIYANPATCNVINLDRLAAQIRSTASTSLTITDITSKYSFVTSASLVGYKLLNGATKVNLQQHWNNTLAGQGTVAPWINLLKTPELAAGTNEGGAGYYNHLTDFRTVTKTVDASGKETYSVAKDLYASVKPYETTALGSIFCMENSPLSLTAASALYGNTTGLVYKFQTTVTGSDAKAGANCFYGYNGEYFESLAALQARYPNAFDAATGTDAASKLAAAESELATAYAAADNQTAISNFRVKYNVKVYTDGIMYYTYFIKDKNYKQGTAGSETNYYSVIRNTIYDLTVKNLKRIGTDIPGGWEPEVDPDDPVDPTNVYMVVEAKVNNWVLSTEEVELK